MAELIGINEASTFWGFCQAHDAKTFAPLETRPILPTDEQAFLLAYRPLVKELYLKEAYFRGLGILRESDRGKGLAAQRSIQERVVLTGAGVNAAIRDLRHHKSNYDRALISRDFAAVRFVAVSLDEVPDILCSGVVQPCFSFAGQLIQDLAEVERLAYSIAFSLLATDGGGAAIFSWLSDADAACAPLVDSLLAMPSAQIPNALVRFAFTNFENIFLRPAWWESLTPDTSNALLVRFKDDTSPEDAAGACCLKDDGVRAVSWKVRGIEQKRS